MHTQYYVQDGSICGPKGYTQCWIQNKSIYSSNGGYTQCWIDENGHIYSSHGGYTQFYIQDGSIYGPSTKLPWME